MFFLFLFFSKKQALRNHPAMALLVELHTKLSKYVAVGEAYDARHLESLAKFVEVREFAVGEAVYKSVLLLSSCVGAKSTWSCFHQLCYPLPMLTRCGY